MEIIPAIDLMDGRVVRLLKGDAQHVKEYSDDPLAVARRWVEMGARRLHIVDLDATLDRGVNLPIVKRLLTSAGVPTQVGGGLRDARQASRLLQEGADRVMLGTLAFRDTKALLSLLRDFGSSRVVVALDYVSDQVMVRGWRESTGLKVADALTKFHAMGVEIFLLTAIQRDGTLEGPDYETLKKATQVPGVYIIASGGVKAVRDLLVLKKMGVEAAILGKALYEGSIDLGDAIRAAGDG